MPDIREELVIFLTAVLTGAVLRLAYRILSCLRQIVRHSIFAVNLEDFIFWASCALYVFVQIYYTSDGEVRWYFVLGIVLGAAFASFFLRFLKKTAKKIYGYLKTYFN